MNAVLQKPRAKTSARDPSASDLRSAGSRYFGLGTSQFDLRRRRCRKFALRTSPFDLPRSGDADGASDVENPYTFTGRRLDAESDLMQYRNRYYDAGLGRFVSRDPHPLAYIETMNLYEYARCTPARATDPLGLGVGDFFATTWNKTKDAAAAVSKALGKGAKAVSSAAGAAGKAGADALRRGAWEALPDSLTDWAENYLECCEKGQGNSSIRRLSGSASAALIGGVAVEGGLELHVLYDTGEIALYGYAGGGAGPGWDLGLSVVAGLGRGRGLRDTGSYTGTFASVGGYGNINSPFPFGAAGLGGGGGGDYSSNLQLGDEHVSTLTGGGGPTFGKAGPGGIAPVQLQHYNLLLSTHVPQNWCHASLWIH